VRNQRINDNLKITEYVRVMEEEAQKTEQK
jgi:hypothetical protein